MSSTSSEEIQRAVHSALVDSVKRVESAFEFGKDTWFNYCHAHAPVDVEHGSVIKDPARYSIAFLGDFLQHVSTACRDEVVIREFTSRKVRKVARAMRSVESFAASAEMYVEKFGLLWARMCCMGQHIWIVSVEK